MSIKVKDLAKELGVPSEDVLTQLRKVYVDADDENSKIDEKIAGLIRIKLRSSGVAVKFVEKDDKKPKTKKADPESKTDKKTKKVTSDTKDKKKTDTKKKETKVTEAKKPAKAAKKPKTEKKPKPEKEKGKEIEIKKPVEEETDRMAKAGIRIVKRAKVEEKPKPPEVTPKAKDMPAQKSPEDLKPSTSKPDFKISTKHEKTISPGRKPKKHVKPRPVIEVIEKGARPSKSKKGKWDKRKVPPTAGTVSPGSEKQTCARKTRQKIQIQVPINIRTLAPHINVKPNLIIQYLMDKGAFVNLNQDLEEETVRDIMDNFGYELELHDTIESIEKELVEEQTDTEKMMSETRAPVVTFMGHVDHGKTSLLDYIRKTMVTKGEKGGITQHIGAYKVETGNGSVTFLDTPGHAAFTAMRARGANATDVVVLVVAADDGIMPQTKEAIDHARAAGVPIVVAINKCDLPGADPERVRQDLRKEDLVAEEWGGSTIMAEVSAITGEGVDHLVEMLMLESEMLELKANTKLKARGIVIESKKSAGQGVVATLLVQNGTLREGDIVLCGPYYGRAKAMIDDKGRRLGEALPSTPVEVLGLQGVPEAGHEFFVVKDEKKARTLSMLKQSETRKNKMAGSQRVTLEDFHSQILEGNIKELKVVLKADVQGSAEALKSSLEELATEEVKVNIIHSAVGNINESDVMLTLVSNAIIIGFHVKTDTPAEELAKSENIDVRIYDIIYEAIADVKAGMEGLLEPEENEVFQGSAQVREVFPVSKIGKVAGCAVTKGTIHRKDRIRVKRGQEIVYEGKIESLKRFKDDVKEAREGFECGISISGSNDIRKNDILEAFIIEKIARRLEK